MLFVSLLSLLCLQSELVASAGTKKCYSLDGQVLGDVYQPCNPDADVSACCALNGTSADNDICLDSGLCQSTSGWFAGFIWANGCTDSTGKSTACAAVCAHMPQQYSFNVLQCNPGTFCCRAAYDTTNCCDNNATTIQTSHIGTLELPGATAVNTTFNASQTAAAATCPSDHTAAVGGALGGILAAVVIGSAIALILLLRQRKSLQQELSKTNTHHETEIAQIVELHNVQSAKMEYSYTHAPPPGFGNIPTPAYQPHQNRPVEMDDERQLSELSGSAHPGSPPQRELSAG